jgi:hypothetical protein
MSKTSQFPHRYANINEELSRKSSIPLKTCLRLTRVAYSEMCPIKRFTRMKQLHCGRGGRRRRLQFEGL